MNNKVKNTILIVSLFFFNIFGKFFLPKLEVAINFAVTHLISI